MILYLAALAAGQQLPNADRRAVLDAVEALLASWRDARSETANAVLHPDFRLTTLQGEGADRRVHTVDRAGLLAAAKNLKPGDWDDRLSDVQVRIGANGLAIVTANYVFYTGGEPGHCGIVSFQLYRQADWKIISFADTHNVLNGRSVTEVCRPQISAAASGQ